jgi:hypothetical protein
MTRNNPFLSPNFGIIKIWSGIENKDEKRSGLFENRIIMKIRK